MHWPALVHYQLVGWCHVIHTSNAELDIRDVNPSLQQYAATSASPALAPDDPPDRAVARPPIIEGLALVMKATAVKLGELHGLRRTEGKN